MVFSYGPDHHQSYRKDGIHSLFTCGRFDEVGSYRQQQDGSYSEKIDYINRNFMLGKYNMYV